MKRQFTAEKDALNKCLSRIESLQYSRNSIKLLNQTLEELKTELEGINSNRQENHALNVISQLSEREFSDLNSKTLKVNKKDLFNSTKACTISDIRKLL